MNEGSKANWDIMVGEDGIQSDEIISLISTWPALPLRSSFPKADPKFLARDFLSRLSAHRLLISNSQNAVGAWCKLPWDSELFGLPMGRVDLLWSSSNSFASYVALVDSVVKDAKSTGIKHLSCRVDLGAEPLIRVLEDVGFRFVDTLQTLSMTPQPQSLSSEVRNFRDSDRVALVELTQESFGSRNRFLADPFLDPKKGSQVYEKWANNCFSGKRGSFLKVSEVGNTPAGYVACLQDKIALAENLSVTTGMIDLIAVSKDFRGAGLGMGLVRAAQNWAAENCQILTVGTRCDNFPALSLYLRAGFQLCSSKVGMHLWLKS
jgi:ribosomal protein S18 acetylase RimI-like enzyme